MANTLEELTQRVARLEQIVTQFVPQHDPVAQPLHDWRECLGVITDDALSSEIIEAGLRLREIERTDIATKTAT